MPVEKLICLNGYIARRHQETQVCRRTDANHALAGPQMKSARWRQTQHRRDAFTRDPALQTL